MVHIQDHKLDNKATIQFIKDQMQDSARCEVEFQLDLCGRDIQCQDLLEHLRIAFQGGDDEANILAKFYSHSQKPKELEEVFADELQLLAHKVISKKPNFHHNLTTMLKQWYANQLYDHNNASIPKTLLLQMPKVMFTQFHNKLARVLGTCLCSKGSTKAVSVSAVGTSSEGRGTPSKSQQKCKAKVSAQSSQIRDLCSKLDSVIIENSQMQEFLNPSTLQTMVTNALHATQSSNCSCGNNNSDSRQGKPFLGRPQEPQLSAGKDETTKPEQTCHYCKDTGHKLDNFLHLQHKKDFLACKQSGEGLN